MKYLVTIICILFLHLPLFAQQQRYHVVQRGETIETIATKYGISIDALKEANSDAIFHVGAKLLIPDEQYLQEIRKKQVEQITSIDDIQDNERFDDKEVEQTSLIEEIPENGLVVDKEIVQPTYNNDIQDSIPLNDIENDGIAIEFSDTISTINELELNEFEELTKGYALASINEENTTLYFRKINQIFKNYSYLQQKTLQSKLYDWIDNNTIVEQDNLKGRIALIDLYALLAEDSDEKLDDLYFQKGMICGLQTGDTIMLKECITALKLSDNNKTEQVKVYISTLSDYLEQIRNYLPLSRRIDGVWVSNIIEGRRISFKKTDIDLRMNTYIPSFILIVNNGVVKMDSWGYAWATGMAKIAEKGIKMAWSNHNNYTIKDDELTYAQNAVDIGGEKLYLLWSNEKIKIPNQSVALSLSQTASDITYSAINETISNSIGEIGGDVIGNIGGSVVSSIIMDMFSPSKKINIVEMELMQKNDCELYGHIKCQTIIIDANGKAEIESSSMDIILEKYDSSSGVFFGSPTCRPKYIPSIAIEDEIPSEYKYALMEDSMYKKAIHINKSLVQYSKYQQLFSEHQIKKMFYYNKNKLSSQSEKQLSFFDELYNKVVLGIEIDKEFGGEDNKEKVDNGIYVYEIDKESPAYLFGIKQGDIILSIDGYEMDSPERLDQYIQSLNPYDWIKVHVKRGKKELDIDVELTWK